MAEPGTVEIERAQPWLGTRVAIRVRAADAIGAHRAIDAAFAEIALLHRRLSFHDPASLLSRLNREAAYRPVTVDPDTARLLRRAVAVAAWSNGAFDPTVGGRLVAAGVLPRPPGAPAPRADASWRDIRVAADGVVRFRRPLWCDLGGIAKGHAVDRAVARLRALGIRSGCVDAGGDVRVFGRDERYVGLSLDRDGQRALWLRNAAVAGSSSIAELCVGQRSGRVIDGRRDRTLAAGLEVAVIAPRAWLADTLTKWVLGMPRQAGAVAAWGAQGLWRPPGEVWRYAA